MDSMKKSHYFLSKQKRVLTKSNIMKKVLKKHNRRTISIYMTKDTHNKRIANIILSGRKLKVFPLKLRISQRCSFSPFLFNIMLELLAKSIRQEKDWGP